MDADSIVFIGDVRIKSVPVIESGEEMMDLQKEAAFLACDHSEENKEGKSPLLFMARKGLVQRLEAAQALLPEGIRFLIKECYRPLAIQEESFNWYINELKKRRPDWGQDKLYEECSKLVAPVEVAPHSTGGAVDLTLINSEGSPLDMGTFYDAEPLQTDYATYTNAQNIPAQAKRNRRFLSEAMTKLGFVNYPTEWWHWSYGDKYWAFMTKASHAHIFSARPPYDIFMKIYRG